MGQEIFYCSVCQSQLRSSDFEKAKAYKLDLDAVCASCAPAALKTFPEHKREQLEKAMAPLSKPAAMPTSTPRSGTGRVPLATSTPKSGTGRVPLASAPASTRRSVAAPDDKNLKLVLLGVAIAGALIVGGLLSMGKSRPPEERESRPTPVSAPPAVPSPDTARAPESARDVAAREAARKAQLFADAHPTETLEQIRLFEQAAIESRGTAFEKEIARALEGARRRVHDLGAAELKTIDDKVRDACAREDYRGGLQILETARKKPVTPDWTAEIDRRVQDVHARVDTAYAKLRAQALLAKPDSAEVKALREKLAGWGFDRLVSDLDRALADAATAKPPSPPPPPPPPPPDPGKTPKPAAVNAEAFDASWNAALHHALGRDFAAAVQELEKTMGGIEDPTLKSQAAGDLEILRAVGAVHADALQALSKWPYGRKISVSVLDYDNTPHKMEGPAGRPRAGAIEIQKGRPMQSIPYGHITPRSLVDLASPKNRVAAAIACLIEGDTAGAKELGGENNPAVPARYWTWAAEAQRLLTDGENQKREGAARYAYYFAMLAQPAPAAHADAALKCRKLLEESASTVWVRRNRALLKAIGDAPREFVAGPLQLRAAGMFRLEVPKTSAYWMSTIDVDPDKRRDNYVEMEFSTLPDLPYRAWAYVGVCCAESLSFWAQGTEFPGATPGSEPGDPVKHAITSATRNHAGHAGRKGPSRWAWVEIPLPKYAAPGAKVLRLLSGSQGFSVAWVLVSPGREKAPTETDLKEWDKDVPHQAGPVGPTIGLAAWFRADAGTVVDAGKVAQWQDQSGNGRHALQVQPASRPQLVPNVVNGKPVLRFDGTSHQMSFECPVNGQCAMTIFLVSTASKNQAGNDLGNFAALQWPEYGGWGSVFISPQQQRVSYRFGTAQWGNVTFWDRPGPHNAAALVMTRMDGAKQELFVQGVLVATGKDKTCPIAHTVDTALIGAGVQDPRTPMKYFAGDIAEIIVFMRAISEAERDAIERYLRGKYGI